MGSYRCQGNLQGRKVSASIELEIFSKLFFRDPLICKSREIVHYSGLMFFID